MKGLRVEIENLNLTLSNNDILKNINLTIKEGETHCFIGPNGGGKSSLLKCILGQMPHTGEINFIYDNEKVIGYVPQILDFDRTLPITIENFMAMVYQKRACFLGISKKYKVHIDEVLERLGISDKKNRLIGNLSGGERQRLLLAQALYPKPNLLILDEPLTGIDAVGEEYFTKIIKELKEEGVTIIWIHHNIKQVQDMADTVTCIKKEIIFSGDPKKEINQERIYEIFS